jgi:hypothetical protein
MLIPSQCGRCLEAFRLILVVGTKMWTRSSARRPPDSPCRKHPPSQRLHQLSVHIKQHEGCPSYVVVYLHFALSFACRILRPRLPDPETLIFARRDMYPRPTFIPNSRSLTCPILVSLCLSVSRSTGAELPDSLTCKGWHKSAHPHRDTHADLSRPPLYTPSRALAYYP